MSMVRSELSEAFFAALLAAQRSDCDCETCQILRSVADQLISKYAKRKK